MTYSANIEQVERERARAARARQAKATAPVPGAQWRGHLAAFLEATKIEVVLGPHAAALAPFTLWDAPAGCPSQRDVLRLMETERLIVFLKARQLGVSWLVCGFAAHQCVTMPGYPVQATLCRYAGGATARCAG